MRIAIDLRPLMGGKISGVEVYILSMLEAIFEADTENEYILWYNAFHKVDISHFPAASKNVRLKRTRWPNKLINLMMSVWRWPKVDRLLGGADVLWVPDPRPAPVSKKCRKVITFHDLSFEEFTEGFNEKTRLWHKLLRPRTEADEAHKVIAVSYFTKNQLTRLYHLPSAKVEVIHEAAGVSVQEAGVHFDALRAKYSLPQRYFLCLSTLEPRKNIKGVIEAYLEWKKSLPYDSTDRNISLVIAGREHPSIFLSMKIEKSPDIHLTGFVDEQDKAALYKNAVAFLYPSFYEGFGLPVLEAMACGAPVITSRRASLPEVAGDAALLVEPDQRAQIVEALTKITKEPLRAELIEKGRAQAANFSWKKAARQWLELVGAS